VADEITIRLEDAQRIFDLAIGADQACSGFMVTDDVLAMRRLAETLGVAPAVCTGREFVRDFPHSFVPFNPGIDSDGESGPGAYARLGEKPDQCLAGSYNRRCLRPEADPIHALEATDG